MKLKKKIWIFNHYATGMFTDESGRHFSFAKNLKDFGHQPTIFCASTIHNTEEKIELGTNTALFKTEQKAGVDFVFIKTPPYKGNGSSRIKNMYGFYRGLFPVAKEYVKSHGKPDVILASSVHPLTLVAGIKIAKKLGVPCVCEVRDLWPESLVAYDMINEKNVFTKVMYQGENWIYKNANSLIFTMEGGKDYIIHRKWNRENGGKVDLSKVYHINNGVDLENFHYNKEHFQLIDPDLVNPELFKVVYAGSIRKANNIKRLVDIAEHVQEQGHHQIKFLIYGDGPDREGLELYCMEQNILNVEFKGRVDHKYIPYILSCSNLNIVQLFEENPLKQYGTSVNKIFEYFASGKPTLSDCEYGYDLIQRYQCGIVLNNAGIDELANAIIGFSEMNQEEYDQYCNNALIAAQDYDFKVLTKKLEQILI